MPMMLIYWEEALHTVKKNAEALVAATKEMGLEVNAHKTKYMTVSRDQNAGRIHSKVKQSRHRPGVAQRVPGS